MQNPNVNDKLQKLKGTVKMGRRRSGAGGAGLALIIVFLVIGLIWVWRKVPGGWAFITGMLVTIIVTACSGYSSKQIIYDIIPKAAIPCFAVAAIIGVNECRKKKKLHEQRMAVLDACIDEHYDVLLAKFNRLVYKDEYGEWVYDTWWRARDDFLARVVFKGSEVTDEDIHEFHRYFAAKDDLENDIADDVEISSGEDFEVYVEQCIVRGNPDANVYRTPTTGDQGVDLLVKLPNEKLIAVQCKYYSSAVGNVAVQEVVAGQSYYGAQSSVVITNNTFTKSARQLAQANHVLLIECLNTNDPEKEIIVT